MVGNESLDPERKHKEEMISLQLYSQQEKKIEKIREEASEVIRTLIQQGQKIDTLSERVNEGVSKTAYKTWEKVNEISIQLKDMAAENEKRDLRIQGHDKILSRIVSGIFWFFFIGGGGSLLGFIFWLAQNYPK